MLYGKSSCLPVCRSICVSVPISPPLPFPAPLLYEDKNGIYVVPLEAEEGAAGTVALELHPRHKRIHTCVVHSIPGTNRTRHLTSLVQNVVLECKDGVYFVPLEAEEGAARAVALELRPDDRLHLWKEGLRVEG